MKKIFLLSLAFIVFNIAIIYACEIQITADKNEYKIGDTAIFTITLKQDHNNCIHEGEEPKINTEGLKLLGKTAFIKIDRFNWQIKYKVEITGIKAEFTAIRECTKDGDKERININVV